MQCDGCGLESAREEIFQTVPKSFSEKTRTLCPECYATRYDGLSRFLFWITLLSIPVEMLLRRLYPDLLLATAVLNFSVFPILTLVSTVAHELGHLLAARLVGMRAFGFEIGRGRVVFEFIFLGMRCRFRAVPDGGRAYAAPRTQNRYRLRMTIMILGGPAATAVLLYLGIIHFSRTQKIVSMFIDDFRPWTVLMLVNAPILIGNLWPRRVNSRFVARPNDGLLIWQVWHEPNEHIAQAQFAYFYFESEEFRRQRQYHKAQQSLEEGLEYFPKNPALELARGVNQLDLKDYAGAFQRFVRLLGQHGRAPAWRFSLFNNIAWAGLFLHEPESRWQIDACSRLALEGEPWSIPFKSTRGAVLVELGQFDEATPLLLDVLRRSPEKEGRSSAAWYLGLANARQGNKQESESYFALARKLDPHCFLLETGRV